MPSFTISGRAFELEHEIVERATEGVQPDPVQEHYVVVDGHRYPPKQVLSLVTGLDRADFTTHQARGVLRRLGFVAARSSHVASGEPDDPKLGPHGGRQASALAPYAGKWVALDGPTDVLVAAETPQDVLSWLAKHNRRASYGMFRVPERAWEAEGLAPL
jgi:hypothetical protein